ncbi:hypothetical protein DSO57_1004688 [Entomophthora muscae]|uniref:Uncharacterized protein n=1 Tax=Entomophthora muscae TaxID=34485 RepID=A0ACC2U6E8_9FUNG|nr:hypothetical protein DSO57_1004688 [Entomophthora muscae]
MHNKQPKVQFNNLEFINGGLVGKKALEIALYHLLHEVLSSKESSIENLDVKRILIYIKPSEQKAIEAYQSYTLKYPFGSVLVAKELDKILIDPKACTRLRNIHNKSSVIFLEREALHQALLYKIIDIHAITTIFVHELEASKLVATLTNFKLEIHNLPDIYTTPKKFPLPSRFSAYVLHPDPETPLLFTRSTDSLDRFKDDPFILNMQDKGTMLQRELGIWASELYFSHALNRLAELVESEQVSSVEGGYLTLEPCLIAANAVCQTSPKITKPSISQKVEALVELVAFQPSEPPFKGIIFVSCSLTAIYLEKTLGLLYSKHNLATEIAAAAPEDYCGPLPSIADALASYSKGDVQVLVTTLDCIPLLPARSSRHIVFFDSTPPLLSYLDLKLKFPRTTIVLLPVANKDCQGTINFEKVSGRGLYALKKYQPKIINSRQS